MEPTKERKNINIGICKTTCKFKLIYIFKYINYSNITKSAPSPSMGEVLYSLAVDQHSSTSISSVSFLRA